MQLKFYETLNYLVAGAGALALLSFTKLIDYTGLFPSSSESAFLLCSVIAGFVINGLGSLLERYYYRYFIGGMPSDLYLDETKVHAEVKNGHTITYTGISRIKLTQYQKAINRLRSDLGDPGTKALPGELFMEAKKYSDANPQALSQTFNAKYALARSLLTLCLTSSMLLIVTAPCSFQRWLFAFLGTAFFIWRYRMWAFYYARQVILEYLAQPLPPSQETRH